MRSSSALRVKLPIGRGREVNYNGWEGENKKKEKPTVTEATIASRSGWAPTRCRIAACGGARWQGVLWLGTAHVAVIA